MRTPFPEWLQSFDETLFLRLHDLLHDLGLRDAMRFANELGNGYVLAPLLVTVFVLSREWRRGALLALQLVLAVGISGFATDRLKEAFPRDRPYTALASAFADGRATLEFHDARAGRSFPSGHTGAACAWAMVLFASTRSLYPRWKRRTARAALVAVPVCAGLARVFVGAHFVLDVVAGAAVGWGAAVLAGWVCSRLSRRVGVARYEPAVPSQRGEFERTPPNRAYSAGNWNNVGSAEVPRPRAHETADLPAGRPEIAPARGAPGRQD